MKDPSVESALSTEGGGSGGCPLVDGRLVCVGEGTLSLDDEELHKAA